MFYLLLLLWFIVIILVLFLFYVLLTILFYIKNYNYIWVTPLTGYIIVKNGVTPYIYIDLDKRQFFVSHSIFLGKYVTTYLLWWCGLINSSFYLYSWEDFHYLGNLKVYWSPVYNETISLLYSIYIEYKACTVRTFIKPVLSFLLFGLLVLVHWQWEFLLSPNYLYVRLLLLLLLLLFGFYLQPKSKLSFLFKDDFKVSKYLGTLVHMSLMVLDYFPVFFIRFFTILVNVGLIYNLFEYFQQSHLFWSVFLSYNIIILLILLSYKLYLYVLASPLNSHQLYSVTFPSIFTFPLGVVMLYMFYSSLWWLRFFYKAYKLGDVKMVFRYLTDRQLKSGESLNSDFSADYWPIYDLNFSAMLWHYTSHYELDPLPSLPVYGFYFIDPYIQLLCEGYVDNFIPLRFCFTREALTTIFVFPKPVSERDPELFELKWVKSSKTYEEFMGEYLEAVEQEERKKNEGQ